jgi:uncharacterized protein (UPF0548 family)
MVHMSVPSLSPEAIARWEAAPFTYSEVGATKTGMPVGYSTLRRLRPVTGKSLESAAADLFSWRVHQRAGLQVHASGVVEEGTVVVLGLGLGRLRIAAPCRVIYVVNEPDVVGFAYGTLPGHPVSGEESFVLTRCPDSGLTFTITAFSRPATLLGKASGPLGRAAQRLITYRYLRASSH